MKGRTASGYAFDIDDLVFTSWAFTDAIAMLEESEAEQMIGAHRMAKLVFGKDLKNVIKDIEAKSGHIAQTADVINLMGEVINAIKEVNDGKK